MANLLLITHGTWGDVLPFLGLGAALARQGHRATVLTHAPYRRAVLDAGLEFVATDTEEEYARELANERLLLKGLFRNPSSLTEFASRTNQFNQFRRELATIFERYVPGETAVVARHTTGVAGLMAAEAVAVPVAWVAATPSQFQALPLMEGLYQFSLGQPMNRLRASFGLAPVHDWRKWFATPVLQLGLWPEWFDKAGVTAPAATHLTGFITHDPAESGELPATAAALLDQNPPPVLVSGGTSQYLHGRFYHAAADACAEAGLTGMLVCQHRDLVPDPLPPGVHWFAELPFRLVMPKVSAVLHHGGIGTLARALSAGTPQVILPYGVDRPDNATRLQRLGLAEKLPASEWTPGRIAALLLRATARRRDPPAAVTSAAADRAARLLATLPGMPPAVPVVPDQRAWLAARLSRLSPEQRRALAGRLQAARSDTRLQDSKSDRK